MATDVGPDPVGGSLTGPEPRRKVAHSPATSRKGVEGRRGEPPEWVGASVPSPSVFLSENKGRWEEGIDLAGGVDHLIRGVEAGEGAPSWEGPLSPYLILENERRGDGDKMGGEGRRASTWLGASATSSEGSSSAGEPPVGKGP
ncbi:hypothetical protein CRG98_015563 [Punica granatum]|uniref:Uncharacterized protein n=1 Tax=Punica granatum TaxID=22663 RepID=A0A2I0K652_PUNGR|nr:hypothetical protein CRG98_015563 [Punica granatum]